MNDVAPYPNIPFDLYCNTIDAHPTCLLTGDPMNKTLRILQLSILFLLLQLGNGIQAITVNVATPGTLSTQSTYPSKLYTLCLII